MKKRLLQIFLSVFVLLNLRANAQCNFIPVVSPNNIILCPNATDTLATTEAYDSYQWYKDDQPIAGANERYYVVHQFEDAGSYFKVEATLNGCAAFSEKVLVDGYAFLPPYIIETGDIGVYDPIRDVLVECSEDTLILTLGTPYTENIQWYNHYEPIKNATGQSYTVTHRGSYTVCGSPAVCPDYNACELIPLNIVFHRREASITEKNDTLFASAGKEYQWFLNGKKIPGATKSYLVPGRSGCYKVSITDKYSCTAISDSYVYSRKQGQNVIAVAPNPVHDVLHMRIKTEGVTQIVISDLFGNRVLQVPFANYEQNILMSNVHTGTYLVQLLNRQQQVIGSTKIFKE